MNATKLLIGLAVLCVALPAQAQSIIEDLILASDTASSILQYQVSSDVSVADALPGWNASIGGNNTVFVQASGAPDASQSGQNAFTSEFYNDGSTCTELEDISIANVVATPEPSSLLLFGLGGLAVALYKGNVAGHTAIRPQTQPGRV